MTCHPVGRCPSRSSTCRETSTYDSESPPSDVNESSGATLSWPSSTAYRSRSDPCSGAGSWPGTVRGEGREPRVVDLAGREVGEPVEAASPG